MQAASKGVKRCRSDSIQSDERDPKKPKTEIVAMPAVTGQGTPSPPETPPPQSNEPSFEYMEWSSEIQHEIHSTPSMKRPKPTESPNLSPIYSRTLKMIARFALLTLSE